MKNTISIFYGAHDREDRGPGKLISNLKFGLKKNNVHVKYNKKSDINLLMSGHPETSKKLPVSSTVGPCVILTPYIKNKFYNFIAASSWHKDMIMSSGHFNNISEKKIHVWPIGINTEMFTEIPEIDKEWDCLIYFKSKKTNHLNRIKNMLGAYKLNYKTLTYGQYNNTDIIKYANKCKFAIVLGSTETQGIAIMEIMSCNLPCFVLDPTKFKSYTKATSVPYFDKTCGIKSSFNKNFTKDFEQFLNLISLYNPRQYILNNHSMQISTKNLIKIIEGIYGQ